MAEADGHNTDIDKNSPSYLLKKRLLRRAFDAALYGKGSCRRSPPEMIAEILKRQKKAREWAREDEQALEAAKQNRQKDMPRSVLAMNVVAQRYAERLDKLLHEAEAFFKVGATSSDINRLVTLVEDMLSYSRVYTPDIIEEIASDLEDAILQQDRESFDEVTDLLSRLKPVLSEAGWEYSDKPTELEMLRDSAGQLLEGTDFPSEAKSKVLETLDNILDARYRDPVQSEARRLYTDDEVDEIRRRVEAFLDEFAAQTDQVFIPLAAAPDGVAFIGKVRSFIFEAGRQRLEAKKAIAKGLSAYSPAAGEPSKSELIKTIQDAIDQLFLSNTDQKDLDDALKAIAKVGDERLQELKAELAPKLNSVTVQRMELMVEWDTLLNQGYNKLERAELCEKLDDFLDLLPQEELTDAFDPGAAFRALHKEDEFTGFSLHFAVLEARDRARELLEGGDYTEDDVEKIVSRVNQLMFMSDLYSAGEQKLVSARIRSLFESGEVDPKAIEKAFDFDDAYNTLRSPPRRPPEGPTLH